MKRLALVGGSLALLAGLVLEYVPFYGSGATVPRVSSVCSGISGLFLQGFAKAFAPKQASQISAGCSTATTIEHFIGPLIIGGLLALAAGVALVVRDRKTVSRA